MEKITEMLNEILKELKFHSNALTLLVETIDARKHDQKIEKKKVEQELMTAAEKLKGTPFAGIVESVAEQMRGKHGN